MDPSFIIMMARLVVMLLHTAFVRFATEDPTSSTVTDDVKKLDVHRIFNTNL